LKEIYLWSEKNPCEKLYNLSPQQEIIVYAAEEQTINDVFYSDQMQTQKSIDFIFGGTWYEEFEKFDPKINLHFWSNFWLYKSVSAINLKKIKKKTRCKYLYICLNNVAHYHRSMLVDMLYKKKLFKHGILSWHANDKDPYKYQHWRPGKITLTDDYKNNKDQYILPAEFNKVFINLVAETTVRGIFVTEKTYNSILVKKPFICLAAPGFHEFLRSQGFRMYDEIISYDFDKETNLEKRIGMILEQLSNLQEQDYTSLFKKIEEKVDYNKKRALEIVRNQEGIPEKAFGFKYYQDLIKDAQCRLDILE
jgi:hypothetical protein